MKKFLLTLMMMMVGLCIQAKTLIVYYSFTNNVHVVVSNLRMQIDADEIRINPSEKNVDYAANNYAIGSALIQSIRNNPTNASSYPLIDPVEVDFNDYDMIIIAAPLWWSNMAAPLQTFLFKYGSQMAGKNIGLVVSSASSGISGVVADAKRLIPDGNFLEPNLWIRSSQTSGSYQLLSKWLESVNYRGIVSSLSTVIDREDTEFTYSNGCLYARGELKKLSLFNVSGAKILETTREYLDVASLKAGIYIVQIDKGQGRIKNRKIVVGTHSRY